MIAGLYYDIWSYLQLEMETPSFFMKTDVPWDLKLCVIIFQNIICLCVVVILENAVEEYQLTFVSKNWQIQLKI